MRLALDWTNAKPEEVTHINAHATSTPVGDIAEFNALKAVFGDRVGEIPVSATKASTGHLLGGTGALEAVFTILAIQNRMAPPTINLTEQDPEIPLDVVTSPRPLGDGPAAGDQQLVRLRRAQRRGGVPVSLRTVHSRSRQSFQPWMWSSRD